MLLVRRSFVTHHPRRPRVNGCVLANGDDVSRAHRSTIEANVVVRRHRTSSAFIAHHSSSSIIIDYHHHDIIMTSSSRPWSRTHFTTDELLLQVLRPSLRHAPPYDDRTTDRRTTTTSLDVRHDFVVISLPRDSREGDDVQRVDRTVRVRVSHRVASTRTRRARVVTVINVIINVIIIIIIIITGVRRHARRPRVRSLRL